MRPDHELDEFERAAQEAFESLPEPLRERVENVHIVVEERPSIETLRRLGSSRSTLLLGLYEGIPLTKRGMWYGMYPVVPDKITLYRKNIEAVVRSQDELRHKIRDVLIHEIAHYYGMDEDEVRNAGY